MAKRYDAQNVECMVGWSNFNGYFAHIGEFNETGGYLDANAYVQNNCCNCWFDTLDEALAVLNKYMQTVLAPLNNAKAGDRFEIGGDQFLLADNGILICLTDGVHWDGTPRGPGTEYDTRESIVEQIKQEDIKFCADGNLGESDLEVKYVDRP